jgi:hypothetical protein
VVRGGGSGSNRVARFGPSAANVEAEHRLNINILCIYIQCICIYYVYFIYCISMLHLCSA